MVPFNVPAQDRSYEAAFGTDAPQYDQTKPDDAAAVARWDRMNRWKLSFMEAAWKYAQFGVSQVQPDLLSVDAERVRVERLRRRVLLQRRPAAAGHQRPRRVRRRAGQLLLPVVPPRVRPDARSEQAGVVSADVVRRRRPTTTGWSRYLSFMTGLQGMAKPPDYHIQKPETTPRRPTASSKPTS